MPSPYQHAYGMALGLAIDEAEKNHAMAQAQVDYFAQQVEETRRIANLKKSQGEIHDFPEDEKATALPNEAAPASTEESSGPVAESPTH